MSEEKKKKVRLLSPIQLFNAARKIKLKYVKDDYIGIELDINTKGIITYKLFPGNPILKWLSSNDQILLLKEFEDLLKSSVVDESIDRANPAEW